MHIKLNKKITETKEILEKKVWITKKDLTAWHFTKTEKRN